jgi:hypothetical protein
MSRPWTTGDYAQSKQCQIDHLRFLADRRGRKRLSGDTFLPPSWPFAGVSRRVQFINVNAARMRCRLFDSVGQFVFFAVRLKHLKSIARTKPDPLENEEPRAKEVRRDRCTIAGITGRSLNNTMSPIEKKPRTFEGRSDGGLGYTFMNVTTKKTRIDAKQVADIIGCSPKQY